MEQLQLPITRPALMNNIQRLLEYMAANEIDNRHVPRRNDNSKLLHLGTRVLSEASTEKLEAYYNHLRERRDENISCV
jgi:hypothetical protein